MKNKIYFFLGLVFLSFYFSCKDDDIFDGKVTANMNGESWKTEAIIASPNLPYDQGMDIIIYELNRAGLSQMQLHLFKIPITEGTYNLDSTGVRDIDTLIGASLVMTDHDVPISGYDLIEDGSEVNELVITEIDGDEIKGTFDISFVKNSTNPFGVNDPDTVIFKNGVFETKLVEN